MNEGRFKTVWKHLCSLYRSKEGHCLRYGCGRDSLARWANRHYSRHLTVESAYTYKEVLKEATRRGWCEEIITPGGYRKYKIRGVK